MTRRGHAPSSWVRAGGAIPESHVGSQEAGPAPRPLPLRENPEERELAAGGDLGGEDTWGGGSDGGGGAGGRGSPRDSKFPPGEDEWGMRMANSGTQKFRLPQAFPLRPRSPTSQLPPLPDPEFLDPGPLLPGI